MSKCRPRLTAIAAALWLALGAVPAGAGTVTVALTGDAAPGGGNFTNFFPPILNSAGQVAFWGDQSDTANFTGMYFYSSGALSVLARAGGAAPGGGIFRDFSQPALNDAGQVSFAASVDGAYGYFFHGGASLSKVARKGDFVPGGGSIGGLVLSGYTLNGSGHTAFHATLDDPGSSNGLFVFDGGSLSQIARSGTAAPGGGNFTSLGAPRLNDAGQVVFWARQSDLTNDTGIYRSSGGALSLIARAGTPAPGGGNFMRFDEPKLNDAGQVAFLAVQSDPTNYQGIYVHGGSSLGLIARMGSAAPGGGTFAHLQDYALNGAGQVAFEAALDDTSSQFGIFRGNGGSVSAIARGGAVAPGGTGTFSGYFTLLGLIASGTALFEGDVSRAGTGASDYRGLYLGDGSETIEVMRTKRSLDGKVVVGLAAGDRAANDRGQVSYVAVFDDGTRGTFLFTPDVHWRRNLSSSWDSTSNWTLGLAPGQVHDVFIDPSADLTITGPTIDRTVRSLSVGGGSGIGTLSLNGGRVETLRGMVVESMGVLTGTGVVGGVVTNRGTVLARNLTFEGPLTNLGLVLGSTGLNPRVATNLINQADGQVRVGSGERLFLDGLFHANAGRFEITGGTLEVNGPVASTGQINAIGGQMRFNGNLGNGGQLTMRDTIARFNGGLTNTVNGLVGVIDPALNS